jgi:spore germination cell wall hydrolase CwlJ-like protein
MTVTRRDALRQFGLGAAVVGVGLVSTPALARNTDFHREQAIPLRNRYAPKLKAQPPFKRTSDHYKKRAAKSSRKHNPKLKARSQRALGTLDTPGNRRDLALTMWGEARGYGTLGMRAIGHVIMNRVKENLRMFGGNTIHGVCHKRSQFSCWNKGDPNLARMKKLPEMDETNPDWLAFLKADKLAGAILSGSDKDNTGGATFYHAEYMVAYWVPDMDPVGVMFGHIFYKRKKRVPHTHDSHHRRHKGEYSHSHSSHHAKKKTVVTKKKTVVRKPLAHGTSSASPQQKIQTGHDIIRKKSEAHAPLPMRHHR